MKGSTKMSMWTVVGLIVMLMILIIFVLAGRTIIEAIL